MSVCDLLVFDLVLVCSCACGGRGESALLRRRLVGPCTPASARPCHTRGSLRKCVRAAALDTTLSCMSPPGHARMRPEPGSQLLRVALAALVGCAYPAFAPGLARLSQCLASIPGPGRMLALEQVKDVVMHCDDASRRPGLARVLQGALRQPDSSQTESRHVHGQPLT